MSNKGSDKTPQMLEFSLLTNTKFLNNYGKCSKISNTFHFLFSEKMLVIRAGILKILLRITNREDPDQKKKQSDLVCAFLQATSV